MKNEKQKRLKRVFGSASEVLHRWANQAQDEARCKNVFFSGSKVYSYGNHYLLGKIHETKNGPLAIINSYRYSNTTAKHINYALHASSHLPQLQGEDPENIQRSLVETQDRLINSLMEYFSRRLFTTWNLITAKDRPWIFEEVEKFNETCRFLGKTDFCLPLDQDFVDLLNDHIKLGIKRRESAQTPEALEKREKNRLKREAQKLKKTESNLAAWKAGGPLTQDLRSYRPQKLRVKGDRVETTQGASVPLQEALVFVRSILDGEKPEEIHHYSLRQVTSGVLHIGCHSIELSEAVQVLGVTETPSGDL